MQILENIPLAPLTTLRIGGPARYFARPTTLAEIHEALTFARTHALPVFILGGGSNLLVADEGFPGLVLQPTLADPIQIQADPHDPTLIHYLVPAAYDWDAFVRLTCDSGLSGLECLAGIPGTVGASPVQNIGAYGQEVSQAITHVHVLDLTEQDLAEQDLTEQDLAEQDLTEQDLTEQDLTEHAPNDRILASNDRPLTAPAPHLMTAADCRFAYRTSLFNTTHRNRYLVTHVAFRLSLTPSAPPSYADLRKHFTAHPHPTSLQIYEAVRQIRRTKGMLLLPGDADSPDPSDFRTAGSFFKNPIVPVSVLTHIAQALSIPLSAIPQYPIASHTAERNDPSGPADSTDQNRTSEPHIKLPAAWLIEQAGFPKGFQLGSAAISTRHTLALVNRYGSSTCIELLNLSNHIQKTIRTRLHVQLEQEPVQLK